MITGMNTYKISKFATVLFLTFVMGALFVYGSDRENAPKNIVEKKEAILKCEASVPKKVLFGEKIPLRISLVNQGKQDLEVTSLETADITIRLKRPHPINVNAEGIEVEPEEIYLRKSSSSVHAQPDGKQMIEWLAPPPQKKTTLKKLSQADLDLDVATLFEGWPIELGEHGLFVKYEGSLEAEAKFEVVFDLEKTVPTLIDLMKSSPSPDDRKWARNTLYIMTGLPGQEDDKAEMKREVEKFQNWWSENRGKVELRGERLVAKSKVP